MSIQFQQSLFGWMLLLAFLEIVYCKLSDNIHSFSNTGLNRSLAAGPYNVLVIVVDDLRTELGTYRDESGEYSVGFTPNMDRFAKMSVQFNRAYAQVALCGPSRASFLTGRTPRSLDYFQHGLSDVSDTTIINRSPIDTLPRTFQKAGYTTRGAGKVFHQNQNLNHFQSSKTSQSTQCSCSNAAGNCPRMICLESDSSLEDTDVINWGLTELNALYKQTAPFFMMLGIRKPHLPYRIPQKNLDTILSKFGNNLENMPVPRSKVRTDDYSVSNYYCDAVDGYLTTYAKIGTSSVLGRRLSSDEGVDLRLYGVTDDNKINNDTYIPNFFSENDSVDRYVNSTFFMGSQGTKVSGLQSTTSSVNSMVEAATSISTQLGASPISDDMIKLLKLGYFASVNYVDDLIGRVLDRVTALDLYKNTVVVIMSDNGFNLGEQGNYCKNTNYEISTRVPLMIKHPLGALHVERTEIVSLLDFYPTLLDLAGVTISNTVKVHLHGTSFADYVYNSSTATPTASNEISSVAYSGINRCWDKTKQVLNNCNTYANINVMGYSIRSNNFRYTEWREFYPLSASPFTFNNNNLLAAELYDHTKDNGHDPDETEVENLFTVMNSYSQSRRVLEDRLPFLNLLLNISEDDEFRGLRNLMSLNINNYQNNKDRYQVSTTSEGGVILSRATASSTKITTTTTKVYDVNYLAGLVGVFSNLLNAEYSCENRGCVPIRTTFAPTSSPTKLVITASPTKSPLPADQTAHPTLAPTTFPLSPAESRAPTPHTTLNPTPGTNLPLTSSPTKSNRDDPDNKGGGYNKALSAGISVVIMLASVAIGIVIFLLTRKRKGNNKSKNVTIRKFSSNTDMKTNRPEKPKKKKATDISDPF